MNTCKHERKYHQRFRGPIMSEDFPAIDFYHTVCMDCKMTLTTAIPEKSISLINIPKDGEIKKFDS